MHIKYPRTFHLPWSPGATSDDKMHAEVESLFAGREVVVTEKLDGENTTLYADGSSHARSLDSKGHDSRDWVRGLAARLAGEGMPASLRICGENCFAQHSIAYERLPSYFLVFGMWNDDTCLAWDETMDWSQMLDLASVPVLYRGVWDETVVRSCFTAVSRFGGEQEGYVVRLASAFTLKDFGASVAKFVRQQHVQSDTHWMHAPVRPNRLADA